MSIFHVEKAYIQYRECKSELNALLRLFFFQKDRSNQSEGKTMYTIVVKLEVKPEHRQDFIKAAFQDGHDSTLHEPGTHRFEVIQDESNPNCFYLSEVYEDQAAFEAHGNGPYFQAFVATASGYYAQKPTWLVRGTILPSQDGA